MGQAGPGLVLVVGGTNLARKESEQRKRWSANLDPTANTRYLKLDGATAGVELQRKGGFSVGALFLIWN